MPDGRAGTSILHYRILRAIGSGGMGIVYEAEDTKLGRRVALKFLPPALARDSAALERFVREARAASALTHPNICTIYAIEEAGEARFIAMELLDGESLDRVAAKRPLAWDALVDTGVQIADALDAAHRRGIIHRDIKPANVFLTTEGRAKVLDFGVAKIVLDRLAQAETTDEAASEQALTGAGVAVGTVAYMSPEQARGEALDARSDVFGLAAVLYEMSTGRRAFDGRTSAVIFNKILESTPEAPRAINPTLPSRLEDVILRGLEKDRDLRYQSAADMRADLKRLKRDASSGRLAFVPPPNAAGLTTPVSSGAVIAAEARRHRGLAGAAALLVIALLGAAGYGLYALTRSAAGTPAGDPVSTDVMTLTRLTTTGDVRGCGSISPDGKLVAYCNLAG
ncbi:MAG: serine/threonine protein kinase, partial [Acidobacteria bacterium]|nr:serine/threonine protein kinase [Acidobacteriota bacterium]